MFSVRGLNSTAAVWSLPYMCMYWLTVPSVRPGVPCWDIDKIFSKDNFSLLIAGPRGPICVLSRQPKLVVLRSVLPEILLREYDHPPATVSCIGCSSQRSAVCGGQTGNLACLMHSSIIFKYQKLSNCIYLFNVSAVSTCGSYGCLSAPVNFAW